MFISGPSQNISSQLDEDKQVGASANHGSIEGYVSEACHRVTFCASSEVLQTNKDQFSNNSDEVHIQDLASIKMQIIKSDCNNVLHIKKRKKLK